MFGHDDDRLPRSRTEPSRCIDEAVGVSGCELEVRHGFEGTVSLPVEDRRAQLAFELLENLSDESDLVTVDLGEPVVSAL